MGARTKSLSWIDDLDLCSAIGVQVDLRYHLLLLCDPFDSLMSLTQLPS